MDEFEPISNRYRAFGRAFGQGKGLRPNAYQRALLSRAATLAAEADKVLADPLATVNDKVRIAGAADRAYAAMEKSLETTRKQAPNEFAAMLAEAAKASS